MPIAFPGTPRGRPQIRAANLVKKPFDYVPAPNLGNPNFRFTSSTLGPGRGRIETKSLPRSPGFNFAKAYAQFNIETRPQHHIDAALWKEDEGTLNTAISGVTRDSTGAILGSCRVMLFRTDDMSFVAETTSDVNGAWTIYPSKSGLFFQVCYKAGSPDVAGASVNTLNTTTV